MNKSTGTSAVPKQGLGIIRSLLTPGFTRTLLGWFLAISLLPLLIISLVNYARTHETLRTKDTSRLSAAAKVKADQIQAFFRDSLSNLLLETRRQRIVSMVGDLRLSFEAMGTPLVEFVKSPEWTFMAEQYEEQIAFFIESNDYYDFLLIDHEGNILYSDKREHDLGTNIFTGTYSGTSFGQSCRSAFDKEMPIFSDFEIYGPSGDVPAAFLVTLIHDGEGQKIGLAAVQISTEKIDMIMQSKSGLGAGEETYLIGSDLRMRSNSALEEESTILGARVETEQALLWHQEHIEQETPLVQEEEASVYVGRKQVTVLGLHLPIEIAGVRMALLTEMPASEAFAAAREQRDIALVMFLLTAGIISTLAFITARKISEPIKTLSSGTYRIAEGDLEHEIEIISEGEIGELADNLNYMVGNLRRMQQDNDRQSWFKSGQTDLNDVLRGEKDIPSLAQDVISFLAHYLHAQVGAIFVAEGDLLKMRGSYAYSRNSQPLESFRFGEGLVGQAAAEKKPALLSSVPEDYVRVYSGLVESRPRNLLLVPVLFEGIVKAVIELGSLDLFSNQQQTFLNLVNESIGIAIHSAQSRDKVQELLEESQTQREELQAREEELRAQNMELQAREEEFRTQNIALKALEKRLRRQNEELQVRERELRAQETRMAEQSPPT